jgi:hypothetical protein
MACGSNAEDAFLRGFAMHVENHMPLHGSVPGVCSTKQLLWITTKKPNREVDRGKNILAAQVMLG